MSRRFPGRYNDGRTAASREVVVVAVASGLEIRDGDNLLIAFWQLADLRADGQLPGAQGVRVRCEAEPDARLTLPDGEFIREVAPSLGARPKRRFGTWAMAASFAAALAIIVGMAYSMPVASRALAALVPISVEREWGGKLARGLEDELGTCRGPAGSAALALLASRLSAGLPEDSKPTRVSVVKAKDTNALALPGGIILIFEGLLKNAEGPDEVAGVLAHELTHVAERHVTAAMIRGIGVGLVVTMVTGDASGMLASGAAALLAGAYSREDEAQADRGAVRMLDRAGIASEGLARFFDRLAKHGSAPEWLSTHPDSSARAAAIRSETRATATAPSLSPEQWGELKGICG